MDGRSVKQRRIYAVGFLAGWLALIVVVGVTARETQELIAEQNTVLANQDLILAEEQKLIETSLASQCGAWRGTYQFLAAWTRSNDSGLSNTEAQLLRTTFKASYNRWCGDVPLEAP